mgnify:FL=1
MTPPLTKKQEELLKDTYARVLGGRDKLYKFIQEHHPDINISRRQVMEWLRGQELNQLTTTPRKTVKIVSSIPRYPLSKLQIDLIDLSRTESEGYKYIMTTIDTFSKYVWLNKLKSKDVKATTKALKDVLDRIRTMMIHLNAEDGAERITEPRAIQTDNGTEFKGSFNEEIEERDIKHIYGEPYHSTSQGVVERMNRTVRNKILKLKLLNKDNNVWASNMDVIEFSINATYSDSTKTTPIKAISMDTQKEYENVQNQIKKQAIKNNANLNDNILKKGQTVRLRTKLKKTDKITDNPTFGNEIYTIERVNKPKDDFRPSTYALDKIKGKYTSNDLLVVNSVDNPIDRTEKFELQRIIRPATSQGVYGYWVKWKGYKDPSFEPHDVLILDVPKDVQKVMKRWKVKQNENTGKWSWKKP